MSHGSTLRGIGRKVAPLLGFLGIAFAILVGPSAAGAATINVTTTLDEFGTGTRCSLREAVWSANNDSAASAPGCAAGSGADTIMVPGGRFNLNQSTVEGDEDLAVEGDLDITAPVSIVHTGINLATVDQRRSQERVFQVFAPAVTIEGLTIQGGQSLSVEEDTGGGILVEGGNLTLRSSVVQYNTATYGGGVSTAGAGYALVVNSTITGNSAYEDGGGISVENDGNIKVRSSTITGNGADTDRSGGGDGGGVFASAIDSGGKLELLSTLVGDNRDNGGEAEDCATLGGEIDSLGHNLIGNANGCGYLPGTKDVINRKPHLLRLAYNGGPTYTHALQKRSPAINAGGNCPKVDQRGVNRKDCDIGAWELSYCRGAVINRIGTPGADLLVGTSGRDGIVGLSGQDTLRGLNGNDGLCGGSGPDTLVGGSGGDMLDGGPGRDTCLGGSGKNKSYRCELPKKKKNKKNKKNR